MIFWQILIVGFLVLLNGFFAMSELALVSSRRVRLQEMAKNGRRGAATALRLLDDPVGFLSTVQVGISLVGIFAGAYSGATLSVPLAERLGTISQIAPYAEWIAFVTVVVAVTYFSLVVGELVPKRIALNHAEAISAAVAPVMALLARIGAPFVWLLRVSTKAVMVLLRIEAKTEQAVSEEEVRALIAEGAAAGVFHPAERDMIEGVLRIGDRSVRSIMVPRPSVVWLDLEDPPAEIYAKIAGSGHSRYPVGRGSLSDIIGVVHTKDLLEQQRKLGTIKLAEAVRDPLYVVEMMPILRLMECFRSTSVHLAIIVDEHGDVEGIATPTDILTAIAGDLPESGAEAEPMATQREDGSWLLDGLMPIDDAESTLGIEGLASRGSFNTIAGFVLHELGHLPAAGDHLEFGGWQFEVIDLDGRRIDKLLAVPPKTEKNTSTVTG